MKLHFKLDRESHWARRSNALSKTFNNLDQYHTRFAACASCCERLLSADVQQGIVEMKIDDLPSEFFLTESQIERLTTLPQYTLFKIIFKW
jgi:hypothetical protein